LFQKFLGNFEVDQLKLTDLLGEIMNRIVLLGVFILSLVIGHAHAELGLPSQLPGSLLSDAQVTNLDFETEMRFNSRLELNLSSNNSTDQLIQLVTQKLESYGWTVTSQFTHNGRVITNLYKSGGPNLKMEMSATSNTTQKLLLYRYR